MQKISINGQEHVIEKSLSLQALLSEKQSLDEPFAVAINDQFIPRSAYLSTLLYPGDCVDIIIPMQGG